MTKLCNIADTVVSSVYKNPLLFFYRSHSFLHNRVAIRYSNSIDTYAISYFLIGFESKMFPLIRSISDSLDELKFSFRFSFPRYERVLSTQASQFQDIITREIWSSSVVDSLWITLNIPVEPWRDRKRSTRNLFNKTTSIYQHRRTIVSTNHTFQPASLRSPYRFLSTREKEREREKILYTSRILLPFPSFLIDKCPART